MALYHLTVICLALVLAEGQSCSKCNSNCPTGDCIANDVTQQTKCTEVSVQPPKTTQCEWWYNGLASHSDMTLLGGKIAAYKLRWFDGKWSGWYVPGVNDVDCKYNNVASCNGKSTCMGSLRRMWAYFYDHYHTYILCKP